jgi:outer membrane immunogenic protein
MRNLKLIIAAAISTFGIGAASAADLPARIYTKAPVASPVYNWTGFYIGGTVGAAWVSDPIALSAANNAGGPGDFLNIAATNAFGSTTLRNTVFTASAKAGYNWQVQSWILGVEGDIGSLHFRRSTSFTGNPDVPGCGICFQSHSYNVSSDWVATFRPRVGYAVDKWMVYGTGGLAVGNLGFSNAYSENSGFNPLGTVRIGTAAGAASATLTGWAAGAGTEYAVTKNWLLSLEYVHVDLGKLSVNEISTNGPVFNINGNLNFTTRLANDILRVGAAYKF